MLQIDKNLLDAMINQSIQEHPIECCGLIAGIKGTDKPTRWIPMINSAHSESFFQFDTQQQLTVWREMQHRNETPVVIYHSHTASIAYPSASDIKLASEPDVHYVIIATNQRYGHSPRSFRIHNGKVVEERINIISSQHKEQ